MKLGLMRKGDTVLSVGQDFVAIKRKKGEVDIIPIVRDGEGWYLDLENIISIGYEDNTVSFENDFGVQITTF